ncbi:hypothetical protein KIPB_006034, partial [Kipferlia bialata]|eukprot:g6034.t1
MISAKLLVLAVCATLILCRDVDVMTHFGVDSDPVQCEIYGPVLDNTDTGIVYTYSIDALNHLVYSLMPLLEANLLKFTIPDFT